MSDGFEGLGIRDESEHKGRQRIKIRKFIRTRRPGRLRSFLREEYGFAKTLAAQRSKENKAAFKRRVDAKIRKLILGKRHHKRSYSHTRRGRHKRRKETFFGFDI